MRSALAARVSQVSPAVSQQVSPAYRTLVFRLGIVAAGFACLVAQAPPALGRPFSRRRPLQAVLVARAGHIAVRADAIPLRSRCCRGCGSPRPGLRPWVPFPRVPPFFVKRGTPHGCLCLIHPFGYLVEPLADRGFGAAQHPFVGRLAFRGRHTTRDALPGPLCRLAALIRAAAWCGGRSLCRMRDPAPAWFASTLPASLGTRWSVLSSVWLLRRFNASPKP